MLLSCGLGERQLVQAVHRGRGAELRGDSGRVGPRDEGSIREIVGETPRAVEDGEAPVGIFVDPHARLDEVPAVALLGDLQNPAVVAHGVVVADDALRLHAQDVVERPHEGHEGAALLGRGDGKAGVVQRPVSLGQPAIGRLQGGDA
jgi:hypothetical protein